MLTLTATLTCDNPGCVLTIAFRSRRAGLNASRVRDTAHLEYGWQVTSARANCLDHRSTPLAFHTFAPSPGWMAVKCSTCGAPELVPQHRQREIVPNHARLVESGLVEYRV